MGAYPVIYMVSFDLLKRSMSVCRMQLSHLLVVLTDNGHSSVTKLEFKQRLSVAIGAAKGTLVFELIQKNIVW